MKDNLESYFKNNLKDSDPEIADWNDLSEDVWTNAASRLDPPKRNRKILFLWTLVGLLFISTCVSSFYLYRLNDHVEQLDSKSAIAQLPLNKTKNKINELDNISNKNLASDINKFKEINNNNKYSPIKQPHLKNKITKATNNIKSLKTNSAITLLTNTYTSNTNHTNKHNNNYFPIIPIQSTKKISQITSPISSLALTVLKNEKAIDFSTFYEDSKSISVANNTNHNPKFAISLYAGTALTSTPMHSTTIDETIKGYNKFQFSSIFGFKIKRRFNNNFFISSGLENIVIKSWSYSNQNMAYNSSYEYNNNGRTYNDLNISMPTPTGHINTTLVFRKNDNNPIKMGEKYNVDMEVHQEYNYISVPLGLGYYKALSNIHSLEMELGMSWLRLLKNTDTFSANLTRSNNNSSMKLMQSTMGEHININKNLFNIYIDLGYNYSLNNKLNLQIGVNYFKSLTSIYSNDDSFTTAHGASIKAGISMKF